MIALLWGAEGDTPGAGGAEGDASGFEGAGAGAGVEGFAPEFEGAGAGAGEFTPSLEGFEVEDIIATALLS